MKGKVANLCDHLNGWGPANLEKFDANFVMNSRGRREEQRRGRGERGKNRVLVDEGFI